MGREGVSGERGETEMGIEAGSEEHIQTGLHSLHHMHMYACSNVHVQHVHAPPEAALQVAVSHLCVYVHTCTVQAYMYMYEVGMERAEGEGTCDTGPTGDMYLGMVYTLSNVRTPPTYMYMYTSDMCLFAL